MIISLFGASDSIVFILPFKTFSSCCVLTEKNDFENRNDSEPHKKLASLGLRRHFFRVERERERERSEGTAGALLVVHYSAVQHRTVALAALIKRVSKRRPRHLFPSSPETVPY